MKEKTTCCVVGGGPAGMMLGFLLARKGVDVTVLEKHKDFNRDFRGDTIHPATLQVFYELGLLDELLKIPHTRVEVARGFFGDYHFQFADFRQLPLHCRFVALMPQWDLLDFIAKHAANLPSFHLRMEHDATGLVTDRKGRVAGVTAKTPQGDKTIHADLVIGCDGRHSTMRSAARFKVIDTGVPIDVLWFCISRQGNDDEQLLGRFNYGKALILINRGDYFQGGLLIRKNSFEEVKQRGIAHFQQTLVMIAPFLRERVNEIHDWDQIKLLSVQINHLRRWYRPGLLCIGDAAHAMSPAGGVGIKYAIQDAIATARILGPALRDHRRVDRLLQRVQCRREWPVRVIQILQKQAHEGLAKIFDNPGPIVPPPPFRAVVNIPGVQRLTGRIIGVGLRPEYIKPRPRGRALIAAAAMVGRGLGIITKYVRAYRDGQLAPETY